MLVDSRQFEQMYIDTDRWIVQSSQRCQHDEIGSDVATVKQQKDIVEVSLMIINHSPFHYPFNYQFVISISIRVFQLVS